MSPRLAIILLLLVAFLIWVVCVVSVVSGFDDGETVRTVETTTTTEVPTSTTTEAPTTTTTQVAPTTQVAVARSAPSKRLWLSSTMYCEHGVMASGKYTHDGAVSSKVLPRGSRWRVVTGLLAGRVFTVEDTGSLAIFDVWVPSCADAVQYGRHSITVEPA